ncbi:MAG: hypothetical protein LPK79_10760 [Bacteroidota bacterium]|nr:hypothetical protein [Bacteroidota bacterium]
MSPVIRNILAVILGWVGGSAVNMGLIELGYMIFPIQGVDPNDMDSLIAAMPTMEPKHFLFPFLAHAIGTLVGAFLAVWIAATHKMKFGFAIGILFLLGGIAAIYMFPGPTWFAVLDLLVAYLPMAYLGGKLAMRIG